MIVEHPRGARYGLMNYDHIRPAVKFRRDRFGQFRDMLEGRKLGAVANVAEPFRLPAGLSSNAFNRQSTAVEVKFFNKDGNALQDVNPNIRKSWEDGEPVQMFSQNLDKFQRSSVPFFDLLSPQEVRNLNPDDPVAQQLIANLGGRVRLESDILGQELIAI